MIMQVLKRRAVIRSVRDFFCAFAICFGLIALINAGPERSIPLPVVGLFATPSVEQIQPVRVSELRVWGRSQTLSDANHHSARGSSAWQVTGLAVLFSAILTAIMGLARHMLGMHDLHGARILRRRRNW